MMKKLLAAVAASAALIAIPAQANIAYAGQDTYLGAFIAGQSETWNRGPLNNGLVFDDFWIFNFSPNGSASFSVNFNPQSTIAVNAVTGLYLVTTNQACTAGNTCPSTHGALVALATTTAGNTVLDFTNIAAGRYAIRYAGTVANSLNDTNYTGQVNFRVATVPEPATLALLGLGLAGLGFARRRKLN